MASRDIVNSLCWQVEMLLTVHVDKKRCFRQCMLASRGVAVSSQRQIQIEVLPLGSSNKRRCCHKCVLANNNVAVSKWCESESCDLFF